MHDELNTAFESELARLEQDAERQRNDAERAVRDATRWHNLCMTVRQSLKKHWWVSVIRTLQHESDFLRAQRGSSHAEVELFESIYRAARQQADGIMASFPSLVAEECSRHKLTLDETSRHPRYTFANGFVTVEVRESSYSAVIAPRDGEKVEIGADPEAVVEKLLSEKRRLLERPFNESKFLHRLYNHYRAIARDKKVAEGEPVPIRRITARMSRDIEKFSIDEFNVDLGRVVQKGDASVEGKVLELSQTRDTNSGMLLYGLESRGYIGFIAFKEVGSGR
jgi:hypothetical protein